MHRLTRSTETMIRQWIYEEERRIAETRRDAARVPAISAALRSVSSIPYVANARKAA